MSEADVPPASAGMEVQRMTTNMPTIASWRPPSPRRLGHDEVSRDGGELCSGASYGVSFGCCLRGGNPANFSDQLPRNCVDRSLVKLVPIFVFGICTAHGNGSL